MTILYAVSAVCSTAGIFFIIFGALRGDLGVGFFLGALFVGIPLLIIWLKKRKEKKAARKRQEEREKQEAVRRAEANARYEAVKAQKLSYEQLCSKMPPVHHFFLSGPRFAAWVSHRRIGEELVPIMDYDLGAYTLDDGIIVPNSVGQVLDQYPNSQIYVCNILPAPSGTSVDLIINPIK